jgi:hypothetical protein
MFPGGAFGAGAGQHLLEAAKIGGAAILAQGAVGSKKGGGAQGAGY